MIDLDSDHIRAAKNRSIRMLDLVQELYWSGFTLRRAVVRAKMEANLKRCNNAEKE